MLEDDYQLYYEKTIFGGPVLENCWILLLS